MLEMVMVEREKMKIGYSVEEVADKTSLSKAYLRNEIRAGRLHVQRFGRRVVVLNDDLWRFLRRDQSDG